MKRMDNEIYNLTFFVTLSKYLYLHLKISRVIWMTREILSGLKSSLNENQNNCCCMFKVYVELVSTLWHKRKSFGHLGNYVGLVSTF